uniref:Uncharacterized protein n=1 Tax=viral metagenome TaxID=1070528 RepID=A0A6C0C163_9ZZZZ
MTSQDKDACITLWVDVMETLGLCSEQARGHLEKFPRSMCNESKQLLLDRIRLCPEALLWSRVAHVAMQNTTSLHVPKSFGHKEEVRSILSRVLKKLRECTGQAHDTLVGENFNDAHLHALLASLSNVKDGASVLYVSALCDLLNPDASGSMKTESSQVCSIQSSPGIWKKKSSYAQEYGSSNTVYSSCAYRASWTLVICLGLAILLCIFNGDFM